MTNREWLHTLSDDSLAKFLTSGLLCTHGAENEYPFYVNIRMVSDMYLKSELGVRLWLGKPQSYVEVRQDESK